MTKETPRNLVLTSAYLTDKPYEVQLEVFRWMRVLLHDVVDRAAATALQRSEDQQQHQQEEFVISQEDKDGNQLGKAKDRCQNRSSSLEGSAVESEPSQPASAQDSGGASSNTAAEAGLTSEDSCKSNRRKRPRKPTSPNGGNALIVGSVVECFHPVSSILSCVIERRK